MCEEESKSRGRPSPYNKSYPDRVYKLCLLLKDPKDEKLAIAFDVSVSSIEEWKRKHPEFQMALKRGKNEADAEVAKSFFERANGYSHEAIDIRVVDGKIVKTPYMKHYPPDVTAGIFILKNRHKEDWRDVHRQEHTGADGGPIRIREEIDLSDCSTAELELAAKIGLRNDSSRN